MAIEVKIIGTDPPCTRCAIMGYLVSETAKISMQKKKAACL